MCVRLVLIAVVAGSCAVAAEPTAAEPTATGAALASDNGERGGEQARQREALKKTLLLLPFRNTSAYEGPWDIHTQLPRGLADSLRGARFIRTIPVDSGFVRLGVAKVGVDVRPRTGLGSGVRNWLSRLWRSEGGRAGGRRAPSSSEKELMGEMSLNRAIELGRELQADVVVLGEVQVLSMKRFRAVVTIGGYRSYQGTVEVELHFYNVIDGTSMGEFLGAGQLDSRRTGVTHPAAYMPMEKEYHLLGISPAAWGSQDFEKSLVGQAVALCLQDLANGVIESVLPPPELIALEPKIIDISSAHTYINVGVADGVRNGDKYGVWDHGRQLTDPDTGIELGFALPERVGVVQVGRVLNDHLSEVRILEGRQNMKKGFSIRAE